MMRRLWIAFAAAGMLTACSAPAATTTPARSSAPATIRAAATTPPSPRPTPTPTPAAVTVTTVRMKDGSTVTIATFSGPVTYVLHDGSEDPGLAAGRVKAGPAVRGAERRRLLAAFNGGFKLDSAGGGFYLNGSHKGALVNGAASVVYYRNGTIKIGSWGRELRMTPDVVGVRQNLKLLVDHGRIPATVDQNVNTTWGATLGGGYYVWRSGLGITRDGRVIFVYGPALNVRELASLLHRAGAVEALQLDINPEWMSYDYYKAAGHPRNPTPHALLPNQQGSVDRYYQVYSRDFTAVYAR
jgi:hypothetical protein